VLWHLITAAALGKGKGPSPLVGYFEFAIDERIQMQAGEKAAQGN